MTSQVFLNFELPISSWINPVRYKKKGEYVTINDIITSRNTVKQNSNTTSFYGARNLIDT